jgi:hypothetical protein
MISDLEIINESSEGKSENDIYNTPIITANPDGGRKLLRNLRIIVADLTASHITKQHFSYEQIK